MLEDTFEGAQQLTGGARHTSVQLQQPVSPALYPIFQTNYIGGFGDGKPVFLNDVMAEGAPATTAEWSSWGICPYPPIPSSAPQPAPGGAQKRRGAGQT
ncbi:MAG: hypothetical protein PHD32_05725 [Eubacteriales bacterium]|nr:hypothetical protein [Eubacteriales bacterium]